LYVFNPPESHSKVNRNRECAAENLKTVIKHLRKAHEKRGPMTNFSRRNFMALTVAAGAARVIPAAVQATKSRYILRLVYDKSIGAMRLIDKRFP